MKYGLMVLCYIGFIGLAYTQSADPIKVTMTKGPRGETNIVFENNSNVMLTAVALSTANSDLHVSDSAIKHWDAIQPGQQGKMVYSERSENIEFKAAIFGDGTTFGDQAAIHEMLLQRRATLDGLGIILQHLPIDAKGSTPPTPMLPLFGRYRTEQLDIVKNDNQMRAAIINVNLIIQRQVQKMAGELPDTIIAAITTMLRDWQAALSNSLPSLTGIQ